MSVGQGPAACRGVADVRDEGRRPGPLGLSGELLVGEGRLGLFVDDRFPGQAVEEPDPAAVHVAVALHFQ